MIDFFPPIYVRKRLPPNSFPTFFPSPMPRAFTDFKELEKTQRKIDI